MQNVGVNAVGEMMRNDRETITVRHMDRERDVSWVVGNKTTEKQADCWEMRYRNGTEHMHKKTEIQADSKRIGEMITMRRREQI